MLSLIAYNFVIDNELPKLEYLTIMDWIILASYLFAAAPNMLAIFTFQLSEKTKFRKFEKYRARGKPGNQIMIPCHAKENCQALPGVKANADYECPNGWVMLPRDHHQLIGNYVTIECR